MSLRYAYWKADQTSKLKKKMVYLQLGKNIVQAGLCKSLFLRLAGVTGNGR